MVSAYDDLIRTAVAAYARASGEIGADVQRQAELVEDLFHSQREFLLSSCRGRSPSAAGTGPEQANRMRDIKAMVAAQQQGDRGAHPAHLQVNFISGIPCHNKYPHSTRRGGVRNDEKKVI